MLFASLLGGERQRSVLEGAVMWNWRLGSGGMIEGEAWRGSQGVIVEGFSFSFLDDVAGGRRFWGDRELVQEESNWWVD